MDYIIKPNGYKGKSNMHKGIITKRINSSVIINNYFLDLNRFYYIRIDELITQEITALIDNELFTNSKEQVGDYNLYDQTSYEVDDYLTMAQLNKKRDNVRDKYTATREILTDNNIDFID